MIRVETQVERDGLRERVVTTYRRAEDEEPIATVVVYLEGSRASDGAESYAVEARARTRVKPRRDDGHQWSNAQEHAWLPKP